MSPSVSIERHKVLVSEEEIEVVVDCLKAGNLVTGPDIVQFEKAVADLMGKKFCASVANGFAALHLAINAIGVKNAGVVVPAATTCYAIINAIRVSGNYPVYCDVDHRSGNIDVQSCSDALGADGCGLIISPNYFGIPSQINALKQFGLPIIEDSAQSFFSNMSVRSSAELTVCSFYPTKMINAVDGGAVLTDDETLIKSVVESRYYSDQNEDDGVARYNYRMENLHVVLGLAFLRKCREVEANTRNISDRYIEIVSACDDVDYLGRGLMRGAVYQKFVVKFSSKERCDDFIEEMRSQGVPCSREFSTPLDSEVLASGTYVNTGEMINMTCSIPLYNALTSAEAGYVADCMESALKKG